MTKLIQTAIQMRDMARAPYYNYKVGAAVETKDGKTWMEVALSGGSPKKD